MWLKAIINKTDQRILSKSDKKNLIYYGFCLLVQQMNIIKRDLILKAV